MWLINELLRRIKSATKDETMIKISEKYENLKNQWRDSFDNSAAAISSSDPLSNEDRREFFFLVLDKEVDRMNSILRKQKLITSQETVNATTSSPSLSVEYYRKLAREIDLERIYDPPGTNSCYMSILVNFVIC